MIWDVATGKLRREINVEGGNMRYLAVSEDGQHALIASSNSAMAVYDLETGTCTSSKPGEDTCLTHLHLLSPSHVMFLCMQTKNAHKGLVPVCTPDIIVDSRRGQLARFFCHCGLLFFCFGPYVRPCTPSSPLTDIHWPTLP